MFQQPHITKIVMRIEHADGVDNVEVTGEKIQVRVEQGDLPVEEMRTWMGASFVGRRWDLHFENIEHLRVEPLPHKEKKESFADAAMRARGMIE